MLLKLLPNILHHSLAVGFTVCRMRHQIPEIISQIFGQGSHNSQTPTAHCLYHTAELYYVLSPLAPAAKSAVAAMALISYFLPMELKQRHCPARLTENYLMLKSRSLTNPLIKSIAVYVQEALQLKSSLEAKLPS